MTKINLEHRQRQSSLQPPDGKSSPAKPESTAASVPSAPLMNSFYSLSMGTMINPKLGQVTTTKKLVYTIIKTDLLIPGDGEPMPNATLVTEGKLVVWVGDQNDLPAKYTDKARETYSVPYLMPGLWDCHVHLDSGTEEQATTWPAYMGFVAGEPAVSGALLVRALWEMLQSGYTSVRDLAGFGCELSKSMTDGVVVGPNIYSSGACISQLAGHGDVFALPAGDVLLNLGISQIRPGHFGSHTSCIVDGEDEVRRAVRLQIRRGAKCIKVLASGGVMSSDDDPYLAQFSPKELHALVDEATRMNRPVAAHCHGKAGIMAAIKAGVTTIEHGSFADSECIDHMRKNGTIYVATREVIELLKSFGPLLPPSNRKKLELVEKNHMNAYKLAVAAGLTIALGTDTGPSSIMAREIQWAVEAGLSNLEALKAATANGPLTVKGQAPKTGQLKVGYEADFIGVTCNPVEDVKVLQNKDNIKWVWKGGKIYKGPGVGPWGE